MKTLPPTSTSTESSNCTSSSDIWIMRLLYFSFWTTLGCIEPYLSLYYKSVMDLDGSRIGWLSAIFSFMTFLSAPLWGILTDRIPNCEFVVVYCCFFCSLLAQLSVSSSSILQHQNNNWSMPIAVCITAIFRSPMRPLIDSMVLSNLKANTKKTSSYGRLRLFATMGFGFGSYLVGFVMKHHHHNIKNNNSTNSSNSTFSSSSLLFFSNDNNNFLNELDTNELPFILHALVSVPAFFCILNFHRMHRRRKQQVQHNCSSSSSKKIEMEQNIDNDSTNERTATVATTSLKQHQQWEQIIMFIRQPKVYGFFTLVSMIGMSTGAVETFCSVQLQEAGLSTSTIGNLRLLSSCTSIPMYWYSGKIQKHIFRNQAQPILILTLFSFGIRFLLYALTTTTNTPNAILLCAIIAESLRGFIFALFMSTAVVHTNHLAPPELSATALMLLGAINVGLGRSMGSMLIGKLISLLGTISSSFICFAAIDFTLAILAIVITSFKDANYYGKKSNRSKMKSE